MGETGPGLTVLVWPLAAAVAAGVTSERGMKTHLRGSSRFFGCFLSSAVHLPSLDPATAGTGFRRFFRGTTLCTGVLWKREEVGLSRKKVDESGLSGPSE